MADLRPFAALRPAPNHAGEVAAPPYDVVDVPQARALARGRPDSFLFVSRPEIAFPEIAPPGGSRDGTGTAEASDAARTHAAGRAALVRMVGANVLRKDVAPTLSVYRQHRPGSGSQTGVVGLASVADYRSGVIAVHEHTRPDKEDDRAAHLAALGAHDEPVFLMYPGRSEIDDLVAAVTATAPPVAFTDHEGVEHTLWIVSDEADLTAFVAAFAAVPRLYVADGHHRSAAAARRQADSPDLAGARGFPAIVYPAQQLTVLPYHRVVSAPLRLPVPDLLTALAERFELTGPTANGPTPNGPTGLVRHEWGMYVGGGRWFRLRARPGTIDEGDPIASLDVAVLQDTVLGPLLGITDPRTDPRLSFVGGSHAVSELESLVDDRGFALAFALVATSAAEVMHVADRGLIMPPKSTWFDPKPASGLFVHML